MNPHSNLASYYRYFYNTDKLPNNLCNYFWGLVISFICLPFVWIAPLINRLTKPITRQEHTNGDGTVIYYYYTPYDQIRTGYGFIFSLAIFFIGAAALRFYYGNPLDKDEVEIIGSTVFWKLAFIYGIGLITVMIVITAICLIIGICSVISKLIPKKAPESDEEYHIRRTAESEKARLRRLHKEANPSFLTLTWRWLVAFKEKNCPLITWDYRKEKDV